MYSCKSFYIFGYVTIMSLKCPAIGTFIVHLLVVK